MKKIIFVLASICIVMNFGISQQIKEHNNMSEALLLIDIQNDYFENGAMTLVNSYEASLNARKILDKFRSDKLPVIHIRHIALSSSAKFFLPGTSGSEIHENVKPLEFEKVIIKHHPNSFRETELLEYLKSRKITDLVICGMMTHMCIDATVRAAKDYGFNITLIGDATATKELQIDGKIVKAVDVQNGFLAALNISYAKVISTQNILEAR